MGFHRENLSLGGKFSGIDFFRGNFTLEGFDRILVRLSCIIFANSIFRTKMFRENYLGAIFRVFCFLGKLFHGRRYFFGMIEISIRDSSPFQIKVC